MEQMEEIKNSQRAKENEYEYKMSELKDFLAQKEREIADKKQHLLVIQEMNEVTLKEWEQKNNEIDNELKNKLIEIKETNKKCKEIESELKRVNVEKDEILKEKDSFKDKFADYVELQYQFRANEK